MTTRQEKRAKRSQLIHQLQRLEIQHQRLNGPDFIISQCEGCDICTKIRAIGEELSPSNVDICTASGLTVERYHEMRKSGMTDKAISIKFMVSTSSVVTWKKTVNLIVPMQKVERVKGVAGRPLRAVKPLNMTKKKYIALREKGISLDVIAKDLECTRATLRGWAKRNGLSDIKRAVKQ